MSADGPVSGGQKKTAVKPTTSAGAAKRTPAATAGAAKPATGSRLAQANKPRPAGAPAARAPAAGAGTRPKAAAPQSKTDAAGKTRVSAASRPGAKVPTRTDTAVAKRHDPKDPLGVGKNIGDVRKPGLPQSSTKGFQSKPGKSTAADPLALGDVANIGKKK